MKQQCWQQIHFHLYCSIFHSPISPGLANMDSGWWTMHSEHVTRSGLMVQSLTAQGWHSIQYKVQGVLTAFATCLRSPSSTVVIWLVHTIVNKAQHLKQCETCLWPVKKPNMQWPSRASFTKHYCFWFGNHTIIVFRYSNN